MSFEAPSTPLGPDVAGQIAHRYRLAERMERAWRMLAKVNAGELLRSHLERTIRGSEVEHRENLDELLAGLSVLHIAGFDRPEVMGDLGFSLEEIAELLAHPAVARYFELHYPYAPPILLRESIVDPGGAQYMARMALERQSDGWSTAFGQFMLVDAAFNAPGPLEDFLGLLDGYTINGIDLGDLDAAFRSPSLMQVLLEHETGRSIVEGLQDFLEFSLDLDGALTAWKRFPLFSGLVWLHYGYWYGAGGLRMREVAQWVEATITRVRLADEELEAGDESLKRARRLHYAVKRLISLRKYPKAVIAECRMPLAPWLEAVDIRRTGDRVRY